MALERGDGHGHGQIGLSGAGGADAEGDLMAPDCLDVSLLPLRLGAHRPTTMGKEDVFCRGLDIWNTMSDLLDNEIHVSDTEGLTRL